MEQLLILCKTFEAIPWVDPLLQLEGGKCSRCEEMREKFKNGHTNTKNDARSGRPRRKPQKNPRNNFE